MAAAFLFTRTTSQSPRLRETLVTVAITNRHSREDGDCRKRPRSARECAEIHF